MTKQKIIQQGAEAQIILDGKNIIKKRVKKSYRHSELDEKIRKLRTRSETKLLEKASQITNIPRVIKSDEKNKEISMNFIEGKKLSEYLDSFSLKKQKEICNAIGQNIGKLHRENIIHGDLTTSNMILDDKEVFFIDFGLGYISRKIEDKAVDIHLLKQALEAKHYKNWETLFEEVIKGYEKNQGKEETKKVLERILAVEKRGRYRH
ncbi:MAG: KEOPS complex kinase/ATPase Bud32 [Candidatus Pacearchaeota archaeon]